MNDAIVRNLCPDHRDKIKGLPCLKCVADRYLQFINEAIDVLDPEMHQNDIRRIRDKALQARDAFEAKKTDGFGG